MTPPTFDLETLLAPVPLDTFFSDYFERRHLVIARQNPGFFAPLLSAADIDHALTDMGLGHPEVMLTQSGAGTDPEDYCDAQGRIDPLRVAQRHADGATLIMTGLQDRLPALAQYCRALEHALSARVQTNIYMTPPGHQGFNPHYDAHDVLVLQIAGSKEWRIYDAPVPLPLPHQRFKPGSPIGTEIDRFTLHPGDAVYVPRGLNHDAVATDEGSLHITTGLMFRTWADLLVETVLQQAEDNVALRRALPPSYANADTDRDSLNAQAQSLLSQIAKAPTEPVWTQFRDTFIAERLPRVPGQLTQMAALGSLTPASHVQARPDLIYALDENSADGALRLSVYDAQIEFPAHTKDALDHCLSGNALKVRDMAGALDDDSKVVLARRLIREGLMVAL